MYEQSKFCATASEWFHVESIAAGVWLISEPGHVNSYLLTSPTGTLLFDSGTGLAQISDIVRKLATGPLTVINSHTHLDHVGGNADLLEHGEELGLVEILGHPLATYAETSVSTQFLSMYARSFTRIAASYEKYRELDDAYFYALAGQPTMRPMPDTSQWHVPLVPHHRSVSDGEIIKVGSREFVVIHLPGHTPDSLAIYEPATQALFAGDSVITAAMWFHGEDADLEQLVESLKKLEQLNIRTVYCAHNLIPTVNAQYITTIREAAQQVLSGNATPSLGHDLLGTEVDKHTVHGINILLPATRHVPAMSTDPEAPLVSALLQGEPS